MDRAHASRLATVLAGLAVLAAATGCANGLERRIAAAEQLRQQAAAQGYEWIATAELIERAREQAARGNPAAGLALADQAQRQAEAALRQASREAEAWRHRVVR